MRREITIYALNDPETGETRYVGKTVNLSKRTKEHFRASDTNHLKCEWIKKLKECDREPIVEVLEVADESNWEERERYWIDYGRKNDWPLFNIADGGQGPADNPIKRSPMLPFLNEERRAKLFNMTYQEYGDFIVYLAKEYFSKSLKAYIKQICEGDFMAGIEADRIRQEGIDYLCGFLDARPV